MESIYFEYVTKLESYRTNKNRADFLKREQKRLESALKTNPNNTDAQNRLLILETL